MRTLALITILLLTGCVRFDSRVEVYHITNVQAHDNNVSAEVSP